MNKLTINQALDKILSSYQTKDMTKYPAIQNLKLNLTELKLTFGGNTQVENVDTVESVIRTGSADPRDWN